jgi:hypothetical protein
MKKSIIRETRSKPYSPSLKRMFGEALKARIYRLQVKEIKIKEILYNLSRMISILSFLVLIEELPGKTHGYSSCMPESVTHVRFSEPTKGVILTGFLYAPHVVSLSSGQVR